MLFVDFSSAFNSSAPADWSTDCRYCNSEPPLSVDQGLSDEQTWALPHPPPSSSTLLFLMTASSPESSPVHAVHPALRPAHQRGGGGVCHGFQVSWPAHLEDLGWTVNTTHIIKKAQQRLFFLRTLRRSKLPPPFLRNFYYCTIESVLTAVLQQRRDG